MKEIPLIPLFKTISLKRLLNAKLAITSYFLSVLFKKNIVLGQPFILTVEPTNSCNLKCPLCTTGNGKMTRETGRMDFGVFKNIIDQTGDYLFYLLLYQQGEPYLNKDFIKFIHYAKKKNIFVTTSTNGHYLNSETASQTVASGLDSIIVSVDGIDQSSYKAYRIGGNLTKVKTGIKNLVQEKQRQNSKTPYIFIQFLVMKHNENQMEAMQSLVKELGADKLLLKTVQVETSREAQQWLPDTVKYRRYRWTANAFEPKRTAKGSCSRPWTSALINWDSTIVPCCFDKNGHHVFGSLNEVNNFDNIWYSKKYGNFRSKILTERNCLNICKNCSQGLRLFI